MVRLNLKLLLTITSLSLCLVSCGYHFSGEGQGPKPGMRCIAIPIFENKTSEPNLGAIFAAALRQEFMQKGPIKVVPIEESEAVLKGTITHIYTLPVAHYTSGLVSNRITVQNRLYVVLDIQCEERTSHKVLWRDPAFMYFKTYEVADNPVSPNAMNSFENRQFALEFLATEMSARIHDRFLSNF